MYRCIRAQAVTYMTDSVFRQIFRLFLRQLTDSYYTEKTKISVITWQEAMEPQRLDIFEK